MGNDEVLSHAELAAIAHDYWLPDNRDERWVAYGAVDRLTRAGGADAVAMVVALGRDPNADMGSLGAGALEDLLNRHGVAVAEQLDEAMVREPWLRHALGITRVHGFQLDLRPDQTLVDWFDCR